MKIRSSSPSGKEKKSYSNKSRSSKEAQIREAEAFKQSENEVEAMKEWQMQKDMSKNN